MADLGGTHCRIALAEAGRLCPATTRRYRNADWPDLPALLAAYRASFPARLAAACLALAGPVAAGAGRLTNLDWAMDEPGLARATGAARALVLNDLVAQGHALGHLAPGASVPLLPGSADPAAPRLVIGLGTGFNTAAVHPLPGGGRLVAAAEAGHAALADPPAAMAAAGFVSVEDVLSGPGLSRLHRALHGETADSAGILATAATDPRARDTLARFVAALGAVAGDLALIHLPLGGIHLTGGMARAIAPHLGTHFARAFGAKGRFSDHMAQYSVRLITDDDAALTGCARALVLQKGAA